MRPKPKAYLVGGGIGSMSAAAFMIRDGGMAGEDISILEALLLMAMVRYPVLEVVARGSRLRTDEDFRCGCCGRASHEPNKPKIILESPTSLKC